jgi:enduracididine biosynthesis enzyme MppR
MVEATQHHPRPAEVPHPPGGAGGPDDLLTGGPWGYTLPLSPGGGAALVQPPPWYFSGEVLMVEYLADPAAVAAFLPPGLEPGPVPGLAAAIFGDWQSCTDGGDELVDPVRSQYREFYVALSAVHRGRPVARCPFCWVDKDFSLVRGLIQGYPKKLGRIAVTRRFDVGLATPSGRDQRYGATLAANDRLLVRAAVRLERPAEVPALMLAPLVHTRLFPAWDPADGPLVELVTGGSRDQLTTAAEGGPAELEFLDAPGEELSRLRPVEVLDGYRFGFAETITGGTRLDRRA